MYKEVWIKMQTKQPNYWEFGGVFDCEDAAIKACSLRYDFIFPASMNERLPDETEPVNPRGYYPILVKEGIMI